VWKDESKAGGLTPRRVPQNQRRQRAAQSRQQNRKNHRERQSQQQSQGRKQVVHGGLNLRIGGIVSDGLRDLHHALNELLLPMQDEEFDDDKDGVNGEAYDSRRPTQSRSDPSPRRQTALAAVKIKRHPACQHDRHHRNEHADKSAQNAGFERCAGRCSLVKEALLQEAGMIESGDFLSPRARLAVSRLVSVLTVRKRDLHVNLRCAALRTKRAAVLDRRTTFFARMIH